MQVEKFIHKIESRDEHGIRDNNYEFKKDVIIEINKLINAFNLLNSEITLHVKTLDNYADRLQKLETK